MRSDSSLVYCRNAETAKSTRIVNGGKAKGACRAEKRGAEEEKPRGREAAAGP